MSSLQILLILLIISIIINSIGFKKTVWFISIGYTFSVVAFGITLFILRNNAFHQYNYIQVILLIIWGIRLGLFIIKRESSASYSSSVREQTDNSQELSILIKSGIWISVSLLYACMFSPAVFSVTEMEHSTELTVILTGLGLLIMGTGITTESVADIQKSVFKKNNPTSYCNTGLYRWVRCPNYFGEIMVWLGNFIIAIPFFRTWWQWAIAGTGLICIVLIMIGSAKRLEKKQSRNYGNNTDFQKYEKTVPILFPWIPLYSLQKIKVYLE